METLTLFGLNASIPDTYTAQDVTRLCPVNVYIVRVNVYAGHSRSLEPPVFKITHEDFKISVVLTEEDFKSIQTEGYQPFLFDKAFALCKLSWQDVAGVMNRLRGP